MALLVHHCVPILCVPLNTLLEATAIRVFLDHTIIICSLYLSSGETYDQPDFDDIIEHLLSLF